MCMKCVDNRIINRQTTWGSWNNFPTKNSAVIPQDMGLTTGVFIIGTPSLPQAVKHIREIVRLDLIDRQKRGRKRLVIYDVKTSDETHGIIAP